METIINQFRKEKKRSFLERQFTKIGTVLAVRAWQPATIIEIDVHLPGLDMYKWTEAQHIKCKVGSFTYRDYTPALWDAETFTCTLFIDAAHDGAGSRWAKSLQAGDDIDYLGTSSAHQHPIKNAQHILLGDQSSIGHFLALQQLAGSNTIINGAIVLKDAAHQQQLKEYFPKFPLNALLENGTSIGSLTHWLQDFYHDEHTIFFLAGNTTMVAELRKILRRMEYESNQIKAQGFWR